VEVALRIALAVWVWFHVGILGVGAARDLTTPLSIPQIATYLSEHPVTSVTEFLAALPTEYHQNATLMHHSRSLQKSSYSAPRQILFGGDARLIFGVSADPEDSFYDVIEYAEFDSTRGTFDAGRIRFNGQSRGRIEASPMVCQTCHGSPWRPIWGQYPNWPGAYGTDRGEIAAEDVEGFRAFVTNLKAEPHLAHLDLGINESASPQLYLKNRRYSQNNTIFNNTLGDTVAVGVYTRLRQSPDYTSVAPLLLDRVLHCNDDAVADAGRRAARRYRTRRETDAAFAAHFPALAELDKGDAYRLARYRLLGVDPATELIRGAVDAKPKTEGRWLHGVFSIYELTEFLILDDRLQSEPGLRQEFGQYADKIHAHVQKLMSTGKARLAAVAKESEVIW
jgi:hypothetical protein